MRSRKIDHELLGAQRCADAKFVCTNCLPEGIAEAITDHAHAEEEWVPIYNFDKWFDGDLCAACKNLFERDVG